LGAGKTKAWPQDGQEITHEDMERFQKLIQKASQPSYGIQDWFRRIMHWFRRIMQQLLEFFRLSQGF
ncbi:MAG: hypothetical protein AAF400_03010, partial [Bacteroidota bacterium]